MKIGLTHSTIRGDEKLLMVAAAARGIDVVPLDVRTLVFNPQSLSESLDVVLERCVSTTLGMHAISFFEAIGIPVVNSSSVAHVCEDKFATSLRLHKHKVPTIPFALVFSEIQAIEAIEQLGGFSVVIKPTLGSWGRLLAKINDRDALEAVLEQKQVLGSPAHKAFYIQKYVEKSGRDIRATTVGNRVVCAIYRESTHWITNTARGAEAKPCLVDRELRRICTAASRAVGGGVLGIDVFETDTGYVVNEVNHTTEFKNVQRVTGVDVAGRIIEYCEEVAHHG